MSVTKKERKKDIEEGNHIIYLEDEARVQIAEAMLHKTHIVGLSEGLIAFRDAEGRLWQSSEPYTLVVTKEVNSDDEQEDSDKVD